MNDAYQNEIAKACVTIYPGLHTVHASEKMELPLKFLATGTRVHTPSIFPRDSLIQPVPLQARRVSTAFRSFMALFGAVAVQKNTRDSMHSIRHEPVVADVQQES